jgi:hypothetical protein
MIKQLNRVSSNISSPTLVYGSQVSSVGKLGYGLDGRGSISDRGKILLR